ncbi:MAG: DNA gyrase subunit A [Alphaproteobacteria bacterium]
MSDTSPPRSDEVRAVSIEEEMQRSYLDYAMSVIVARAIPDVRDGLKPVHRRILYAMRVGGFDWSRPFRKSARIVGDVMGKYHPHGDSAIYDALVRMAQDFSMRLPLISGQGNFGSMDGDPPAAMRYTEARLANSAEALLADIDRDTVDFQPNYDESDSEPTVLPAEFPHLLVNGAGGIAVGMATNIPPHNLGEVIDAALALMENPNIDLDGLMEHLPGPDFPTGGLVMGKGAIRTAYETGRASVIMRAKTEIDLRRNMILVHEVPFQVNKARLVARIDEVSSLKLVEGISALRDESDRHGVRVVMELKRDANAEVVLNQLFRHTPLQTTFGVNMLALNGGRPELLPLKAILEAFVTFREQVIARRTQYELRKARDRGHVLLGLTVAVANIDEVIAVIRAAADPAEARAALLERAWPAPDIAPLVALLGEAEEGDIEKDGYRLTEIQARAILDLRLHRLTGLEREKIAEELGETAEKIREYLEILGSRTRLYEVMREELIKIKEKFGNDRRTALQEGGADYDDEDLIQREEMVVTVTANGYIKRVPLTDYREQRRGGKGRSGMSTRDEDVVRDVFVASTHAPVIFFTTRGIAYKLKVYKLPLGSPQARGRPLVQLLPLQENETISAVMPLPEDPAEWERMNVMFSTQSGSVRRNLLSDFSNVMSNGKIAMKLGDDDALIGVALCEPTQHVLLATAGARCIRFPVEDVRVFASRASTGNRGIDLAKDDAVISLSIIDGAEFETNERDLYLKQSTALRRGEPVEDGGLPPEIFEEFQGREQFILTIASNGLGKRTSAYDYRVTRRGGKGIELMGLADGDTEVAAAFPVAETDGLVLVTNGGQLIRCPVEQIRIARRSTRGVKIFDVGAEDRVVSVSPLRESEVDDDADEDGMEEGDVGEAEGSSDEI